MVDIAHISPMSTPAEKALPEPVTMTARGGDGASEENAAWSSRRSSAFRALSLSGRFSVNVATVPSFSIRSWVAFDIGSSLAPPARRSLTFARFSSFGVVGVKAATGLLSEPPRGDEIPEEHRRAVLVITEIAVQDFADREHGVEPDEIRELER